MGKNLPAVQETWVPSCGSGRSPGEENGNALQYSFLDYPMTEELGRLQSMGSQRIGHNLVTEHQQLKF